MRVTQPKQSLQGESKRENVGWLIRGTRPARRVQEWPYSTDPRDYALPGLEPMTDEEYDKVSGQLKFFVVIGHAIDFCYGCGFRFTVIRGYRFTRGEYRFDQNVTDEVLDASW
jgi:hypothetical protein